MGAGSSAEQRSPQDGVTAAGESQPSSPEAETPTAPAGAEPEQAEGPAKVLQKNGQISSINGITEEQVELSLKTEELNGQQAEVVVTDVGQRETPSVILKEESAENMETKPLESTDENSADDEQGTKDADEQLPSPEEKAEEQEQPSESPSNDVGFKKVFKFVGFKFTVRKDKTEKSEPVQLLNVKSDDTKLTSVGAGDHKEANAETVEEATQSEVSHPLEKTEQETQTVQAKEETSPEKVSESPIEPPDGSKETEVKSDGNESPESPTSPSTSETASPLRKFFTQGWAGFRKRTSFRKPKEEEQQAIEREKQEQEKVAKDETAVTEELETEKPVPEKDTGDVSVEASDEKLKKDREEIKMVDVSTETLQKKIIAPLEQPSPQESVGNINKDSEVCLNEKIDLTSEEKSEPVSECFTVLEQSTLASSEKKPELAAPLATEVFDEKLEKPESTYPMATEEPEQHFEVVENKYEPKAPLATEIFDERPTEMNIDVSIVVEKEDTKPTEKELTLEQLVEADAGIQRGQPTDEQLKVKEAVPELVNEQIKQIELSSEDAATSKPPEGITNEVELFSSQERAKIQGSPLKKLFTGSSLKKLSGKKHKGKKEEAKSGEAAEQIQQLSDSAESPEEPKAESSASSPEDATESVEKAIDATQITETEEGAMSDMERKRESVVTPWASFKKMVTPKKRVRRLSESDKEEELDKIKTATVSSTESAACEEQEDIKENSEEQKFEKNIDEPKRKVDTSVSWEALICVGSSKKRARKSSSSDEEVGQRLAQEGQKMDESVPNKETVPDMTFTSSQESDQGQGTSSPEQAGSPSEGEGVSTWESFKRLVTPRRKSKTKMDERNEESATVPSLEHSASDGDSGKEESWVSFKKLMPGRRKKKSDGIPEHAPVEEAGEEMTETNDEDSDVPAVVPLSEYEAAEEEKFEAQRLKEEDITKKKTLDQKTEKLEGTLIIEQTSEGLVHAVTVTVVEGERPVTSIEERSPSWISAAVTQPIEHASEDEEKQTEQISETGIVEEGMLVTKLMPKMRKDVSGDTIISELEIISEAVTAREEASGVEEATEMSCAEETTEMVSAVSRLTESPDTTEIATPVQEVEESQQNLEELNEQTQEVLQEVAERVKMSDAKVISEDMLEGIIKPLSVEKTGQEITASLQEEDLAKSPLKEEPPEKTGMQSNECSGSGQSQHEAEESDIKKVLEKSSDVCVDVKECSKETTSLDGADESKIRQETVGRHEETNEEQMTDEEDFVIVTVTPDEAVTPEEEQEVKVGTVGKQQQVSQKASEEGSEYSTEDTVHEVKMNLEVTTQGEATKDDVPEVAESAGVTCKEKPPLSQKLEQDPSIIPDLEAENTETSTAEVKKVPVQNEIKDAELLIEPPCTEAFVLEAPMQSKLSEVPVQNAVTEVNDTNLSKDAALDLDTESIAEVSLEVCVQNKDNEVSLQNVKTETHVQKVEPEVQLQKLETEISVVNAKPEPHLLTTGTLIHVENVEREMPVIQVEVEVHKQNVETMTHIQKVETKEHIEAVKRESHLQSMEVDILVEKEGGKVDIELTTEMTKADTFTEKAEVEASTDETEAEISAEKAYGKVNVEEKVDVETHVEREEAEVANTKMDVEASIEKVEAEVPVEKVELEVPIEKAEAEVSAEEAEVKAPVEMMDTKLNVEAPTEKVDVEIHAKTGEAKIAKTQIEVAIPAEKVNVVDSTEDTKAKSLIEKGEAGALTEKVVEAPIDKAEAKVDVETPKEKTDDGASTEQPEEMVKTKAATKQSEPKETLQNVETEVKCQSEIKDTMNSLATCAEIISGQTLAHIHSQKASVVSDVTGVPVQREAKDVLSLESKSLDAVVSEESLKSDIKDVVPALEQVLTKLSSINKEEPVESGQVKVSVPDQDAVDLTQSNMVDARHFLHSQCIEIATEDLENKELGDVTIVLESKCTEEIINETSVQREIIISPMKNEVEPLQCMSTTASESPMQSEKEDALAFTLEPKSIEVSVTEDSVKNETTVKKEFGSIKFAIDSQPTETVITEATKTEVEEDILISDSRCTETVVLNAILEDKGATDTNGISVQDEICPNELEKVSQLSESTVDVDSCQRRQVMSEKTLRSGTEKPTENVELACGDVLYAAPVQQEMFAKQQEVVAAGILEVQSCGAHTSSSTVTTAAVEEQVFISENDMLTEKSTETLQSLLEEPKETTFKIVQQASVALPGLGAPDTEAVSQSEKAESVVEESDLSAPERSSSLTHIELQKDVVRSASVESQSSKIVLKIIRNAVDKLEETEEPVSLSKQQDEPCLKGVNESEIQEGLQIHQQLPMKGREENIQEIQPPLTQQKALKKTEDISVTSDRCADAENWDSRKADADLEAVECSSQTEELSCTLTTVLQDLAAVNETVKEIKKETGWQKENGEPKLESEVETDIPAETKRATVESIASGEPPKESLDIYQPKLKDVKAGQTVHIQEQCIEQQTHVKRKEDQSQPTGFVETHTEKDVNNQDFATCGSPQLKSELTES